MRFTESTAALERNLEGQHGSSCISSLYGSLTYVDPESHARCPKLLAILQEPTPDERSALKSYFHLFRQVPFSHASQPVNLTTWPHPVASTLVANAPPSFKRCSKSSHLRQVDLRNSPRLVLTMCYVCHRHHQERAPLYGYARCTTW